MEGLFIRVVVFSGNDVIYDMKVPKSTASGEVYWDIVDAAATKLACTDFTLRRGYAPDSDVVDMTKENQTMRAIITDARNSMLPLHLVPTPVKEVVVVAVAPSAPAPVIEPVMVPIRIRLYDVVRFPLKLYPVETTRLADIHALIKSDLGHDAFEIVYHTIKDGVKHSGRVLAPLSAFWKDTHLNSFGMMTESAEPKPVSFLDIEVHLTNGSDEFRTTLLMALARQAPFSVEKGKEERE
jgi:hypothetical protein